MGGKCSNQKMVSDDIVKAFEQHTGFNLANMFPSSRVARLLSGAVSKAEECHRSLDRQLDDIIREHREKGADEEVEDLLMVLLRLHDEGSGTDSLSMDSVKAIIIDLIAAGSGTTAVSLDWIMAELMKNPAVMKKAQTEVRQQFQGRERNKCANQCVVPR
ncbi:Cytochrome P450 family protein [Rhynchospora pubera]|nr:Cytochrome P450 family protein [Rhynchospora pubera]